MREYFVYMLRCFDGSFYIGVTNDVDRRFGEHVTGIDSSSYTYSRRPLRLVYVAAFTWVDEAIAFEKKLKCWSHRKKRALADGDWNSLKRYARGKDASLDFASLRSG